MIGKKMALSLLLSLLFPAAAFAAEGEWEYVQMVEMPENAGTWEGEFIPVLMYHHFSEGEIDAGNGVVTTTEELEDHLKYFRSQGYEIISLEKLDDILDKVAFLQRMAEKPERGLGLEKNYLCITIDDGYLSNFELGYPIFRKYDVPISIFAVTDYITEQTGIPKFTWEQAQQMEESGLVRIYSHSADHEPVQAGKESAFLASAERSEAALRENLRDIDKMQAIAYPNGRYTAESRRLLSENGYEMQFTVENGVITAESRRDRLPRIMVTSGMDGRDVLRKIELAAERALAAR